MLLAWKVGAGAVFMVAPQLLRVKTCALKDRMRSKIVSRVCTGVAHSGSVSRVGVTPDKTRIVSVGTEGGIFIW